ncbi:hypothetical protein J5N97_012148 [Dioscorea zingiberensis]|uniref:Uncharacterized protein n=1 Tax=Dioscorea zingiberensis TaxID=325984 RepID=A0A9D5CPN2_9LILI|nr:hypothetical protein J5N97_012148 [Dioscorea zingiberensis]
MNSRTWSSKWEESKDMALLRFMFISSLLFFSFCCSVGVEGRLGCMSTGNECVSQQERASTAEKKMASVEELKGGGDLVGWDLRWVPSGPDPMHHNGSPRKPRSP